MNSWIGGGLSSLKGQLTHLITEGTEEVSDPKGDLMVARQKISELESQIRSFSLDVKELSDRNNDLKIKLQSEEMLMLSVSDSYKDKLRRKEECIDSLREQLSSCAMSLGDGGSESVRGDQWSKEFYDFVNDSTTETSVARWNCDNEDSLRLRISELTQEVLRWRSVAEDGQNNRLNDNGDRNEESLAKLLEAQRQDMDLQHSNLVLELQQEHTKQLHFLNRKLQQSVRSSENEELDAWECPETEVAIVADEAKQRPPRSPLVAADSPTQNDQRETGTQTERILAVDEHSSAACSLHQQPVSHTTATSTHEGTLLELHGLVRQSSLEVSAQDMLNTSASRPPHTFADSMSQVSDISEVSIRSRMLDEHVRHLSNRIEEYERQLTTIDSVAMASDKESDPEDMTDKLQHLKMKLSERKNMVIEQSNLLSCTQAHESDVATIAESWESSSANSLVDESNNEARPTVDVHSKILTIYQVLCPQGPAKDLSVEETLDLIKKSVVAIVSMRGDEAVVREEVSALPSELTAVISAQDEKTWSIEGEDVTEVTELRRRNCELEEAMKDLSSTVGRYENLERVCDVYEKEIQELKGCRKKMDLGMDSEDILEHVKSFNEEKDECIEKLESRIISLQNLVEEKDDFIKALKERELEVIYEYDCSIEVLNCELDNLRGSVEKSYENEIDYKKQIGRLNVLMREKDEMINSLNEELTMLSHQNTYEEMVSLRESGTAEGCIQTFEEEGECVQEEEVVHLDEVGQEARLREEAEHLAIENQRLEEVIEAQADSLGQYEAKVNCLEAEIARISQTSNLVDVSESSEEMARETLHHLSQMIRDKDWEIEALKSKNESLCAIIQEASASSGAGQMDNIDSLLTEKEALCKEVLWYQENREQLVNALNLKHKESLNYHGEIQRLIAFINLEQTKWTDLTLENEQMKEQMRSLLEDRSGCRSPAKALVDCAVQFRDNLPSYEECLESARGEECHSLRERVSALEAENGRSAGEIRRLETHLERVSFELEESRLQLAALMESHDSCQTQMSLYQDELAKMHASGTQLVDTAKDIWGEVRALAAQESPQEEHVTLGALDRSHIGQLQCEDHLDQIDQLRAKELKLLKEKKTLQEHLIRIEESYTQDATVAEDREQCLRKHLRDAEDQLVLSQEQVATLEKTVANMTGSFLVQTGDTRLERDEALRRLRDTESRLAETALSLNNLQKVLDKFQQEQALELSFQKERLQQEVRAACKEREDWKTRCQRLQSSVEEQNDIVEAAQRLTDQMELKEDQLAEMQASVSRKDELVDNLKMEIRKLNTVTESKVDKVLMRNLVIGYFHTPPSKRQDALRVIGSLLQFSDKDYHQVGIDTANKSRWFSWLRPATSDSKDGDSQSQEHSFSELFIRFLERESTPQTQLRLPTNQIATEARRHSSLSQSEDLPYLSTASLATIPDHHKFFSPSPMLTKRNGAASEENGSADTSSRGVPPLFVTNLQEPKTTESGQRQPQSHRRGDSNRNALLSLLEQ